MRKRERLNMLKFEMSEMKKFSVGDVDDKYGVDESDFVESGVYKIEIGSRGEVESVSKVEVIDGVFEVESVEEILNSMDEESRDEMSEWVDVEKRYDGVVEVIIGEENGYDFVRVEVEVDEEDVFENGELIIEEVSNEEGDDSGVLVYSYNGKYVVMSFDFGGSLCELDVYESLDEVKEVL